MRTSTPSHKNAFNLVHSNAKKSGGRGAFECGFGARPETKTNWHTLTQKSTKSHQRNPKWLLNSPKVKLTFIVLSAETKPVKQTRSSFPCRTNNLSPYWLVQSDARTRRDSKKESLLDTIHTQQKRTHAAILKAQWSLVIQVFILIIGNLCTHWFSQLLVHLGLFGVGFTWMFLSGVFKTEETKHHTLPSKVIALSLIKTRPTTHRVSHFIATKQNRWLLHFCRKLTLFNWNKLHFTLYKAKKHAQW